MTAVWVSVVFPHFLYLIEKRLVALFGVGNVCHSSFHGADVVTCAVDYLLCQLVIAVGDMMCLQIFRCRFRHDFAVNGAYPCFYKKHRRCLADYHVRCGIAFQVFSHADELHHGGYAPAVIGDDISAKLLFRNNLTYYDRLSFLVIIL